MKRLFKKYTSLTALFSMLLCMTLSFTACSLDDILNSDDSKSSIISDDSKKEDKKEVQDNKKKKGNKQSNSNVIQEDGEYTTKEDVALYLHTYNKLSKNFITKAEARKLGWRGGGLDPYADGKSIGGDVYTNVEKTLPTGTKYHECDIDTRHAKKRGAKRIVYSDNKKIYYTEDHYKTFKQLY